jgi:hypothetical protein
VFTIVFFFFFCFRSLELLFTIPVFMYLIYWCPYAVV